MTLTIRQRLEAIVSTWDDPALDFPRALAKARGHAVAALKALDEAAVVGGMPRDGDPHLRPVPHRLVPDPEKTDA